MKQTDPQFKLRLPPALKQELEDQAAANDRTLGVEIVSRLQNSLHKVAIDEGSLKSLQDELVQQREIAKQFRGISDFLDGVRLLTASLLNDTLKLVPDDVKLQGIEQQFADQMMKRDRLGAAYSLLSLADGSNPELVSTLKNLIGHIERQIPELPREDQA